MNAVIFHRPDGAERRQAMRELLAGTDATAVVFSPYAADLAQSPQPASRADHHVVRLFLDPRRHADSFNPLDVLGRLPLDREDALAVLLEPLNHVDHADHSPIKYTSEPVWRNLASKLLEAVVDYYLRRVKPDASLTDVLDPLYKDDVVYNLAVVLDREGRQLEPNTYVAIASYLQRADADRSGILSLVHGTTGRLVSGSVRRAVERTTFDLGAVRGGGATVYVEIPAPLWRSHGLLARVWLAALLQLASAGGGGRPPLFVVDHAAGLEAFPQLLAAQRLPAGSAEVWSFWESLGQMRGQAPGRLVGVPGGLRPPRCRARWGPRRGRRRRSWPRRSGRRPRR